MWCKTDRAPWWSGAKPTACLTAWCKRQLDNGTGKWNLKEKTKGKVKKWQSLLFTPPLSYCKKCWNLFFYFVYNKNQGRRLCGWSLSLVFITDLYPHRLPFHPRKYEKKAAPKPFVPPFPQSYPPWNCQSGQNLRFAFFLNFCYTF